jgi:hypothetical protein
MAKKVTSRRVASIAGGELAKANAPKKAKTTAASALSQREKKQPAKKTRRA